MIEPDDTIRFEKDDVPDMPEIRKFKKPKHKKHEEPEPKDWRPLGMEW